MGRREGRKEGRKEEEEEEEEGEVRMSEAERESYHDCVNLKQRCAEGILPHISAAASRWMHCARESPFSLLHRTSQHPMQKMGLQDLNLGRGGWGRFTPREAVVGAFSDCVGVYVRNKEFWHHTRSENQKSPLQQGLRLW